MADIFNKSIVSEKKIGFLLIRRYRYSIASWVVCFLVLIIISIIIIFPKRKGIAYFTMTRSPKYILALLEEGLIAKGKVTDVYYEQGSPAGWKVEYIFSIEDNGENTQFVGQSQGPKKYYNGLSIGDLITVVYQPEKPENNREIRSFLNNPSNRYYFKKSNKMHLLSKYEAHVKLEEYTNWQWYEQMLAR
ncbi:MAG: hypothetical protein WCZ89_02190 [Phycisphaerae bacterium]